MLILFPAKHESEKNQKFRKLNSSLWIVSNAAVLKTQKMKKPTRRWSERQAGFTIKATRSTIRIF